MRKSVHSREYKALTGLLTAARKKARLTQQQVADRLGRRQSFVAKVESGERRLDVLEFIEVSGALRTDPRELINELRKKLRRHS